MTVCSRIKVSSCYPVHDSTHNNFKCAVSLEIGFHYGVYKIKSVTYIGVVVFTYFYFIVPEILTKNCFTVNAASMKMLTT